MLLGGKENDLRINVIHMVQVEYTNGTKMTKQTIYESERLQQAYATKQKADSPNVKRVRFGIGTDPSQAIWNEWI